MVVVALMAVVVTGEVEVTVVVVVVLPEAQDGGTLPGRKNKTKSSLGQTHTDGRPSPQPSISPPAIQTPT